MSLPPKIRKLDEVVVNRIAAGEVIQRPANALKELIENCLDAKATNIQITVKEGGMKLLQIQDNGTGIRKDDMEIVCERFTTSKLVKIEDLQALTTYGFRGEALASISHVAQLTITTKTMEEKCAYKCSYCDGALKAPPTYCAGNQGTTITVENLFYNVPTRRKALTSATEEFSRVVEVVTKYAVHNPSIGFSLKKHGETNTYVKTPHSSTKVNNIRFLYGNQVACELDEVEMNDEKHNFKLHALITNPNYSNKRLVFLLFINHRLVESSMLKKMLEDLYSVHLPKKAHPWCYISLEIDPHNVDVNVHPTKHEVRFLHEDSIIEKIKIALDEKLSGVNGTRTFYMKSKLPNVDVTKQVLKEVLPDYDSQRTEKTKKPYAHEMIRTNSSDQKLDKFNFSINSSTKNKNLSMDKSKETEEPQIEKQIEKEREKSKESLNIESNRNIVEIQDNQEIQEIQSPQNETVLHSEVSNSLEDYVTQEDNSTCFMLPESDESNADVTKSNKPVDLELESPDRSLTADKALERIYKHWGSASKTMENDESVNKNSSDIEKSCDNDGKENETEEESEDKGKRKEATAKDDCNREKSPDLEFKSYSVNDFRREVKLKSILMLRKKVEDNYHAGLREILSNLIFVGCIDEGFSLIQSGINLYICNTQNLVEELFYEIMLYDFANYGVIKFSESLPIYDLALLGLETKDAGWTKEDGKKEDLAKSVEELLLEKADMMKEYFSIVIDKKGNLKSLPILLDQYYPNEAGIPLYILRLATEVDWNTEQICFQNICRETAKLYSQIDIESDTYDWKHVTEHILYSAIKESLLPPNHFAHDSTLLQLASLSDLYKVFERC